MAMDPKVFKKTRDTLGAIIKNPPMSDKLLSKPPFRYLHDIITAVVKTTGFMQGLFTEEEQVSDNVKDKEKKIAYLQKAVDFVSLVIGKPLAVRPGKIVAGQEVEKTNEFLQAIAKGVNMKVNTAEFLEKMGGGQPSEKSSESKREKKGSDKEPSDKGKRGSEEKENKGKSRSRDQKEEENDKDRKQEKSKHRKEEHREHSSEREKHHKDRSNEQHSGKSKHRSRQHQDSPPDDPSHAPDPVGQDEGSLPPGTGDSMDAQPASDAEESGHPSTVIDDITNTHGNKPKPAATQLPTQRRNSTREDAQNGKKTEKKAEKKRAMSISQNSGSQGPPKSETASDKPQTGAGKVKGQSGGSRSKTRSQSGNDASQAGASRFTPQPGTSSGTAEEAPQPGTSKGKGKRKSLKHTDEKIPAKVSVSSKRRESSVRKQKMAEAASGAHDSQESTSASSVNDSQLDRSRKSSFTMLKGLSREERAAKHDETSSPGRDDRRMLNGDDEGRNEQAEKNDSSPNRGQHRMANGERDRRNEADAPARIPRPSSAKGSRRRREGASMVTSEPTRLPMGPQTKTLGSAPDISTKSADTRSKTNKPTAGLDSSDEDDDDQPQKGSRRDDAQPTIGEDDLPPQVIASKRIGRPSSARAAPPRLKKQEPMAEHEPAMRLGSGKPTNLIVDNGLNSDDDDNFMVEESSAPMAEPDQPMSRHDEEDDGEHGGLVKKMLETKKELQGGSQQSPKKRTEIERPTMSDAARRQQRDMVQKEVNKLQASIQTLTRSANPLGKVMDYVQEDLDAMQKELDKWKQENKQHALALKRERGITERAVEPLNAQLTDLDQAIGDQLDLIAATKANIIHNDERIEKMLRSVGKS